MYQMFFIDTIHDIKISRFRKALNVIDGFLKRLYIVYVCSLQLAALHVDEDILLPGDKLRRRGTSPCCFILPYG